ncbi:MAG: 50S ribosomal protein L11 methyltransferase [Methanobacterium sp.]|nr:50S ribosomal protein L11 methyltransferase [Methanobacterium sp.]
MTLDDRKDLENLFIPCQSCEDFRLRKFTPLSKQIDLNDIDTDFKRCKCGKRHLDVVMAHILKIMIDEGIKDKDSTLRNVCTPLITPALPLNSAPYLFNDSLVILDDEINESCARRIINEIPEVKGVLKGSIRDTVGVKDSQASPHTYQLLAGCDLRFDVVYTPWNTLHICKYQGQIHIEFPKPLSPKIKILKDILNRYADPTVVDCTCGPGTLGIAALKSGVKQVIFNDLWYPACETTLLNLELNGFTVEITGEKEGLIGFGENFKVYCMDVKDLKTVLCSKYDICLIDVFPGVDSSTFTGFVEEICEEVVNI